MAQFAGVCRLVWNLGLEHRRDQGRLDQDRSGDSLNDGAQARELTDLRAEFDVIGAVHVTPLPRILKSLDDACPRAWKGLSGYPKPKKRGVHDVFSDAGRDVRVEKLSSRWGQARLPKTGWVRFRLTRPAEGSIGEVSVTRTPIGWQVSIGCLIEGEQPDNGATVGVERGVRVPLMLSDGRSCELPHEIGRPERQPRRARRDMARHTRGSRRHGKAVERVARLSARQARARKHGAHTTTTDITRSCGGVVVAHLCTGNMTRRAHLVGVARKRGLNRAILNVGWHRIETMLADKAARFVTVDPAETSRTRASCGTVDRRSRESQASCVCPACGHRDNADRTAAINILNRGNTPGVEPARRRREEARTAQDAWSSRKSSPFRAGKMLSAEALLFSIG